MNIIELAKEAGYQEGRPMARLERFAALVRAEALEEAAKVCDGYGPPDYVSDLAAAIRGLK